MQYIAIFKYIYYYFEELISDLFHLISIKSIYSQFNSTLFFINIIVDKFKDTVRNKCAFIIIWRQSNLITSLWSSLASIYSTFVHSWSIRNVTKHTTRDWRKRGGRFFYLSVSQFNLAANLFEIRGKVVKGLNPTLLCKVAKLHPKQIIAMTIK